MYIFSNLLQNLVYVFIGLFFIYIAKGIADHMTHYDDDYEIEKNNLAMSLRRSGLYLGLAIAMVGALSGNNAHDFWRDVATLSVNGILAVMLLLVAGRINDNFILRVDNDEAIRNGNLSVGAAEFGSYIASGFIINGIFSGEGRGLLDEIIMTIAFFFIGQAVFVVLTRLYQSHKKYDAFGEMKSGNVAAGIAIGGMLIALGVIMRASMAGPFVSWTNDIASFLGCTAMGVVLVLAFRGLINKVFLSNAQQEEDVSRKHSVAALILTESLVISLALYAGSII